MIDNLDDNSLSLVFQLATDTLDISASYWLECELGPEALRAAINISQVCSKWRALILGMPTVWARIWDFRFEAFCREFWVQEIIRRSKGTPLRIRCFPLFSDTNQPLMHLTEVLEREWHRVQYFLAMVNADDLTSKRLNSVICRPAPLLRLFSWSSANQASDFVVSTSWRDSSYLFGNDAPMLQQLRYFGKLNPINAHNAWLRNITVLVLHFGLSLPDGHPTPSVEDLLLVLQKTTCLESVDIRDMNAAEQKLPFCPTPLPYLRTLALSGSWNMCTDIIDGIDVDDLSALSITAPRPYPPAPNVAMDMGKFSRWFIPLLQNYLSAQKPNNLYAKLDQGFLRFGFECGNFMLYIDDDGGEAEDKRTAIFLVHLIQISNVETIAQLGFFIDMNMPQLFPYKDQIRDMFLMSSHLTTLNTTWPFLRNIHNLLAPTPGVLPSLRTLEVSTSHLYHPPTLSFEILQVFLSWRIADSRPIEVLKVERTEQVIKYRADGYYPELQQFRGLNTVIWKGEYEHGPASCLIEQWIATWDETPVLTASTSDLPDATGSSSN